MVEAVQAKYCQICGEPSEKSFCVACDQKILQQSFRILRKSEVGRRRVMKSIVYENWPRGPEITG